MTDTETEMRRSISMPVAPLHLEQKTLKRSEEKEIVYAIDDAELSDDGSHIIRRSSPAIITDNSESYKVEPTMLRGLPKHLHSVRDFLVNSVNLVFSIFRKFNSNTNASTNANTNASNGMSSQESPGGSHGTTNTAQSNGQTHAKKNYSHSEERIEQINNQSNEKYLKDDKNLEKSNDRKEERVVFSL